MARFRVGTVIVDLCRSCRSAWFDAGELPVVIAFVESRRASWAGGEALSPGLWPGPAPAQRPVLDVGAAAAETLFEAATHVGGSAAADALVHATSAIPDALHGAGEVAASALSVAGEAAGEAVSAAGEAVGAAVVLAGEAAGEAVASAGHAVAEMLASLFDGF
jgi:hypothetical protein